MDEKDLQIFLTLAETGNLTRTAEKLYLAQPTLSKRLQNLESELGATLFLRSKHGVTLTPAGEAARETFLHTTRDFEDLRERLQKGRGIVSGTLRIATSIDYSTYRLPEVLAQYTTHYPEVKLQIYSEHSRECVRQMQTGRPHIAIMRGECEWDEGKLLLERESVCLIRNKTNADTPLEELRYIDRDANPEHQSMKARWLMEHKLEPSSILNVEGLSTCVAMVKAGLGWSIVPEICLSYFDGIAEPLFFADGTPLTCSTAGGKRSCPRYGHSSRPSVSGRTSPPPCRASDRFSKPQSTCSLMQAGCGFCHFLAESNCRAGIGVVYY